MSSPRRLFTKSVVISRTEVSIRLAKERQRKEREEESVIYLREPRPGWIAKILGLTRWRQSTVGLMKEKGIGVKE